MEMESGFGLGAIWRRKDGDGGRGSCAVSDTLLAPLKVGGLKEGSIRGIRLRRSSCSKDKMVEEDGGVNGKVGEAH